MIPEIKILLFFVAVVAVYVSLKGAQEKERRRIAEKLFERADDLLKTNRLEEAAGALNIITRVIYPTGGRFYTFTAASKIVTRKKFDYLHRRITAKLENKRRCRKNPLSEEA